MGGDFVVEDNKGVLESRESEQQSPIEVEIRQSNLQGWLDSLEGGVSLSHLSGSWEAAEELRGLSELELEKRRHNSILKARLPRVLITLLDTAENGVAPLDRYCSTVEANEIKKSDTQVFFEKVKEGILDGNLPLIWTMIIRRGWDIREQIKSLRDRVGLGTFSENLNEEDRSKNTSLLMDDAELSETLSALGSYMNVWSLPYYNANNTINWDELLKLPPITEAHYYGTPKDEYERVDAEFERSILRWLNNQKTEREQ